MLNYNFSRVFKARGIDKPFTYLCNSGFSDQFATKVKNNKIKRLGLKEMEKLCLLLKCTPNDFMEWIPDADYDNIDNHPMDYLKKTYEVDMVKTINSIPLGQIQEIEQLIKEKLNKKYPE